MQPVIVKGGSLRASRAHRILIIQLGDIGDVVLTTPTLVALRKRFPTSKITMAVRQKAQALMEDCPLIDAVMVADKRIGTLREWMNLTWDQMVAHIRFKYDLAIDLRTGTRGAILALLSSAPQRVSFYANDEPLWRNWMFTHLAKIPYEWGTYVGNYYHEVLRAFELSEAPGPIKLWINEKRQDQADQICRAVDLDPRSPFIILQPFSLWPYKELPVQHYIELIASIQDRLEIPVAVVGGPDDRFRADVICQNFSKGVVNLAGKTSLAQLAALLYRSRLFVGIDSAGLHIAAAVGRSTVGIFGPSAPESWAPRGNRHLVVQPDDRCVPCRGKGCQNSGVSRCLLLLPTHKIMTAIETLIDALPEIEGKGQP
jgi:heptosyltransferase-3